MRERSGICIMNICLCAKYYHIASRWRSARGRKLFLSGLHEAGSVSCARRHGSGVGEGLCPCAAPDRAAGSAGMRRFSGRSLRSPVLWLKCRSPLLYSGLPGVLAAVRRCRPYRPVIAAYWSFRRVICGWSTRDSGDRNRLWRLTQGFEGRKWQNPDVSIYLIDRHTIQHLCIST